MTLMVLAALVAYFVEHPPLWVCLLSPWLDWIVSSVKECHEGVVLLLLHHFVCCSVAQTCPTLCDSMDCSIPGPLSLTVSLSLPEFMSIASVMLSSHLVLCHPLVLLRSIFPTSGSFPMSWLFASGDQNAGTSGVASVLPMNIQG